MKKVLILGSSGFIGKNIFEYFKKEHFFLYGTYLKNKPKKNSRIKFIKADLTIKNQVKKILRGMDIVIQAAAVTGGIKDANKNITKYIADNVIMNSYILQSVFENQVKHFIFLSCTVMYPSSKKPLKENDFDANGKIHHSYLGVAWNKVYIEKICKFYSSISRTKFTILRHSNVFGPYDTFDLNKSHVCAATIKKVFDSNNNKIKVWGNGREGRDLLFVYDLVEAIRLSIKNQKNKYEIFNIGSGKLISVNNLVKNIIQVSNKKMAIIFDKTKPTNNFSVYLDCRKANKLLKWQPTYDLNKGLVLTIDWFKTYLLNK